jgi:RNA polymerase sigma factor (sigma-70 family)
MRDVETVRRELLVLRCQQGERPAFEELVRAWEPHLLYYIGRLVGNEADRWQILQDVWVKVLSGIHGLHDPGRLPAWLYAITRHTIMDYRRELFARAEEGHPAEAPEPVAADDLERFETAEQVHWGLSHVSLADREVLTLFFLRDLSTEEIAEVLGIPRGTVKSRLFTARKNLRTVLQEKEAADG